MFDKILKLLGIIDLILIIYIIIFGSINITINNSNYFKFDGIISIIKKHIRGVK